MNEIAHNENIMRDSGRDADCTPCWANNYVTAGHTVMQLFCACECAPPVWIKCTHNSFIHPFPGDFDHFILFIAMTVVRLLTKCEFLFPFTLYYYIGNVSFDHFVHSCSRWENGDRFKECQLCVC